MSKGSVVSNAREQVGVPGHGKELFYSSFVVPVRIEVQSVSGHVHSKS